MLEPAHALNSDALARNGGIDIQDIGVEKKSAGARIQFNDAAMKAILEGGFDGFTPVFIQMTPIESPLMIFGMNTADVPPGPSASADERPAGKEHERVEI